MFRVIVCVFLWLYVSVTEPAELCKQISPCSCRNSDGLIDLSPLAKSDGPAYKDLADPGGEFTYSWNPCISFTEKSCKEVAGCQLDTTSGDSYTIGTQNSSVFINDASEGLQIQYSSGARTLYVTLKCERHGNETMVVKGEDPQGSQIYYMTLQSIHACPGTGSGGGSGSFSIGYVIVIVCTTVQAGYTDFWHNACNQSVSSTLHLRFFGIVILYVVGGVLFQKFVRKESGVDLIPNHIFWSSVVGSIHAGFLFVFRCGKDRRVYTQI